MIMQASRKRASPGRPSSGLRAKCLRLLWLCGWAASGGAWAAPFAYITNTGFAVPGISVIDIANNTVVGTVAIDGATGVAVSPRGDAVYAATGIGLAFISGDTNTLIDRLQGSPLGVAVSPDGQRVYTTNPSNGDVSVIDPAIRKVIASVPLGYVPNGGIDVSPRGDFVYAAHSGGLAVISTGAADAPRVVGHVPLPFGSSTLAVTPDGAYVYSSNGINSVAVISTASRTVVATIQVGYAPTGIAFAPDGELAYVANAGSDSVSVIDTRTRTELRQIPVGMGPFGLSISPGGDAVYVANRYDAPMGMGSVDGTVSVIDTATFQAVAKIRVGGLPFALGRFIVGPPTPECRPRHRGRREHRERDDDDAPPAEKPGKTGRRHASCHPGEEGPHPRHPQGHGPHRQIDQALLVSTSEP